MPHGPALPAVVGGRYRLTDRLGGGGMAQVYRAEDPQLDRTVAVKLMSPRLRSEPGFDARFRRERRSSVISTTRTSSPFTITASTPTMARSW